ncbi:MAG: hypothetical protein H8D42_02905, partial [Candidatus Marinimicrobia bacterium]|nr:hypothetical protein [Candidatus Neomarinimicrobiota bacterium]
MGESWIRRIAENHLTQLLEVPVSIGILETNLFNRLQIEDFRISQSVDQPILYLKKAGINYNVFKLLQKSLDIKSLNLDSMTLFIERDSSGRFVFDYLNSLLKPDTTTSQFTVALQQFHIERSLFQYNDLSIPLNGALAQTFIHVRQTADSTYQLQLRSAQSNITIKQILVVFSDVQVDADLKNGNITLAEFQSVSAELTLSGSLTTTLPELEASLRIQGNPQTSLKTSLQHAVGVQVQGSGPADVVGKLDVDNLLDLAGGLEQPRRKVDEGGVRQQQVAGGRERFRPGPGVLERAALGVGVAGGLDLGGPLALGQGERDLAFHNLECVDACGQFAADDGGLGLAAVDDLAVEAGVGGLAL